MGHLIGMCAGGGSEHLTGRLTEHKVDRSLLRVAGGLKALEIRGSEEGTREASFLNVVHSSVEVVGGGKKECVVDC